MELAASRRWPRFLFQAVYHLKRDGILAVLRRAFELVVIGAMWPRREIRGRGIAVDAPSLALLPGDLIEVKSYDEILSTLDRNGRYRGLLFLPEMMPYCGRRFRVHKRLERIYLEHSGQIRAIKNTVLLENVFCSGVRTGCDKSCFLYWREIWLRRTDEADADGPAGSDGSQRALSRL